MARIGAALAGVLLLPLLFLVSPAQAATAIYYSAPENAYGWCAGYSSGRSESCARNYCKDAGGTACELALECDGGWGAVAMADDPAVGIGAACGMGDAGGARAIALSVCMAAAKTACWTDATFTRNGSASSAEDNRDFDRTYLAQIVLQVRHYDPGDADGRSGPGTRAAVNAFQTDLARTPTGDLDDELLQRLLDAIGGAQNLARIVKRDVIDTLKDDLVERSHADVPTPAPEIAFGDELMARTPEERLLALATILASSKTKCALPALDATPMGDAKDNNWSITCAEGSYVLMMTEDSRMIMNSGSASSSTGNGEKTDNNVAPAGDNQTPTDGAGGAPAEDTGTPTDENANSAGTAPSDDDSSRSRGGHPKTP